MSRLSTHAAASALSSTTGMNLTAFRGDPSSPSLLFKLDTELIGDFSPRPRNLSNLDRPGAPESASEIRLNVERGVDGIDDALADGDVERLCAAFFSEERSGGATRVDDDAVCGREDGGDAGTRPRACACAALRAPCSLTCRRELGPRCGVREVCSPIAICAIDGGCAVRTGDAERRGARFGDADRSSGVENIPRSCFLVSIAQRKTGNVQSVVGRLTEEPFSAFL